MIGRPFARPFVKTPGRAWTGLRQIFPGDLQVLYLSPDGVTAKLGTVYWDDVPTIDWDGVVPGDGPSIDMVGVGPSGTALIVRGRADMASVDIVGDVQVFGPIYASSDGVKVIVGEDVALYETSWEAGDWVTLAALFKDGQMRAGLLDEYSDPVVVPDPIYPPSGRNSLIMALPYGASYTVHDKALVRQWLADTFDMTINGGADLSFQSRDGYIYAIYVAAGTYMDALPEMRAWALERGWLVDDMLTHVSVNYVPASKTWKDMEKFIAFMNDVDISTALYATGTNTTLDAAVYLAQQDPFDQINVTIAAPGVGGTVGLEYWNGTAWAALSHTDGTSGLTASGQIYFVPPADWTSANVYEETPHYWVRLTPIGFTTDPVVSQMEADDWLTDGLCRGWDPEAPGIINSGELLYNPTPPAGSDAKFRHQGRVTGYWNPNQLRLNSSKYVGDVCMAGEYFLYKFILSIDANPGANGIMWDTAYGQPTTYIKTPTDSLPYMDYDFSKYGDYTTTESMRYKYVIDRLRVLYPNHFISGNLYSAPAQFVAHGDANLLEYYQFATKSPGGSNARRITLNDAPSPKDDNKFRVYDGLLPENNPTGVKCMFMYCADGLDYSSNSGLWDKSNRDPILSWAKHLIAQNPNIYFCYHYEQDYRYDFSSEILVWKFSTTITEPIVADLTGATKTIRGVDFSGLDSANSGLEGRFATKKRVKIGDDILVVSLKVSDTEIQTITAITGSYPAGTQIRTLGVDNWIYRKENPPLCDEVYAWSSFYFPAMDVDIGVPDPDGHNAGAYNLAWKTPGEIGGPDHTEIWRRDYTKAIVLVRSGNAGYADHYAHYQTPCDPIPLGGTYYPLRADGTLGEGITEIALRAAEGAILMKNGG